MKQALLYSLKVWLTTLLLPMSLVIIVFSLNASDILSYISAMIEDIGTVAIIGLLLFILANFLLVLNMRAMFKIKGLLSVLAVLMIGTSYYIIKGITYLPPDLCNMATYIIIAIASIWFYKLKPVQNTVANVTS